MEVVIKNIYSCVREHRSVQSTCHNKQLTHSTKYEQAMLHVT